MGAPQKQANDNDSFWDGSQELSHPSQFIKEMSISLAFVVPMDKVRKLEHMNLKKSTEF